jgi:thiol-disulfide isomerase/thioredoxin
VFAWRDLFAEALPYRAMLDREASPAHRPRWEAVHALVTLTDDQKQLLRSFRRTINVLVLNGAWCGDCINQCPIFDHFANESNAIALRFLDRDRRPAIRKALEINGGNRVPVAVFLSEDFHEVARYGDRTLSRYRQLARDALGASCPTGYAGGSDDIRQAVVGEWLAEFERVELLLRLSSRLREKHGD